MKILGISVACCVTVLAASTCLLFGSSEYASATPLAGFVTSIPGPGSIQVGKIRVAITEGTTCFVQPDSDLGLKLPQVLNGRIRWRNRRELWNHGSRIACSDLAPVFGSRIDLWGRFTKANTFAAAAVVIHRPAHADVLQGAALLEEAPSIQQSDIGLTGEAWIDGYPMQITPDSAMITAPADTELRYSLHGFWHNITIDARARQQSAAAPFTADLLQAGAWTTYHATATPDGHVAANQIRVWFDKTSQKEEQFVRQFEPAITPPDYARHIDGKVEFKGAPPISIVADARVQEWVSTLGERLVPPCWQAAECSGSGVRQLRFVVVRQFPAWLGGYFVVEGRDLPVHQLLRWDRKSSGFYAKPKLGSVAKQIVVVPDGTVLIPNTALVDLSNEAQLAALLSYAITSVIQHHAYHMNQHYLKPQMDSNLTVIALPYELWEFGQVVRIGIRQMYVAGYDIREAPTALTVDSDSTAWNPLVDRKSWAVVRGEYGMAVSNPKDGLPLFPAYAFQLIGQYYKDVDYSKLKRGRKEYQQFLQELRKADPEAFAPQKPQSAANHKSPK